MPGPEGPATSCSIRVLIRWVLTSVGLLRQSGSTTKLFESPIGSNRDPPAASTIGDRPRSALPEIRSETFGALAEFHARMFSPLGGTVEDPATGSANGALVALLASLDPAANALLTVNILQGVEMGRPSVLAVSAEKRGGSLVGVRVGGRCTPVMAGTLVV